jgi:fumarate hydratase class II
MSLFGKIFPETLFPRKLSADAEQRLRIAQARAEEALVRTHVENALMFINALTPDVGYERALDIYVRELGVPDPLASVIATRALVALGDTLVPPAPGAARDDSADDAMPLPKLRIDDAERRRRA